MLWDRYFMQCSVLYRKRVGGEESNKGVTCGWEVSHLEAETEMEKDNDKIEIEKKRWRERTGHGARDAEIGAKIQQVKQKVSEEK